MIIDTFEIVIKSNAKQAQKEVKETGEEVEKTQNKLLETDKVAKALSDTLLSVGLKALAAFTTFEGLKNGIRDAVNFNASLEKTHQLFGANVQRLNQWDIAFTQFGANRGEFLEWINQIGPDIIKSGGSIDNVIGKLRGLSDQLKGMPEDQARLYFQNIAGALQIPQDFYQALRTGGAALDEALDKAARLSAINDKSAAAGQKLKNSWEEMGAAANAAFTQAQPFAGFLLRVGTELLKAVRGFFDIFTGEWSDIGNIDFTGFSPKTQRAVGQAGYNATTGAVNKDLQAQSRAFWTAQGFSPAQVAGLLANEQAESGYNPGAVGDNGQAKGIFQWHGDRRKNILDALGIDISTASHADQLKAAAWELQQRGDADRLRTAQTPEQAAGIITQYFERPADVLGQSAYRGRIAASLSAADNSPLNNATTGGSSNNVSIGNITVHTQATDANGIASDIKKSLDEHLSYMIADVNDGIAK